MNIHEVPLFTGTGSDAVTTGLGGSGKGSVWQNASFVTSCGLGDGRLAGSVIWQYIVWYLYWPRHCDWNYKFNFSTLHCSLIM